MSDEKKVAIKKFLESLYEMNENSVAGDSEMAEIFGADKPFAILCKCGSTNIAVTGDKGCMGSPYTGYMEGTLVVKCVDCGNAITTCI